MAENVVAIYKLRTFFSKEKNKNITYMKKIPDLHLPTHADLFKKIEKLLEIIPEEERWNLFYTANYQSEKASADRNWEMNDCVWFDVDNIDLTRASDYVDEFFNFFQLDRAKTVVVRTGNGLQFLVQRTEKTYRKDNPKFFEATKKAHAAL